MDGEDFWFGALKLFLVFGPLLGFAALELILLRRDRRRAPKKAVVRGATAPEGSG